MPTLVPRFDFRGQVYTLTQMVWNVSIRTIAYCGYYLCVIPIFLTLRLIIYLFLKVGGLSLVFQATTAYTKLGEAIPRFLLRIYTYNSRPHIYLILDENNSGIRLLKVRSVKSVWGFKGLALINAELISCPIASAPPFIAVSYRWEANKSMPMMIGRRRFDAPRAIHKLLLTLQSEAASNDSEDEKYLWIDSICINQSDTKEKSWQIGLMKNIYRSATHVLCWLGAAAPPVGTWRGIDGVRDAAEIICNDFFFRVWIIQEISLARKIVMRTRTDSSSWDDGVVGICRDQGPAFSLYGENQFGLPASIMPRLKQGIKNMGGMESFRTSLSEHPDGLPISELLVRSVEFQCSDPRDRVYGLLGLTTERARSEISVKYHHNHSELDATLQAARFSLVGESSFELLEMSGIGAHDSESSSPGTSKRPTWVPYWQSPHINQMAVTLAHAKSHITAAHRPCRVTPPILSEDRTLCIEGAVVDTVQEFITTAMALPKTCDLRDERSRNQLFHFLDNLDLICKTAREAKERNPDREESTHDAMMRIILDAGSLIDKEPLDFSKRRDDMESLSQRLRSRLANAKDQVHRSSVVEMDFMHFLMGLEEFMPLLIGRRLCRTGKGDFGIVPPGTKQGDVVCAFSGAPNPFVLRPCRGPHNGIPEAYQVVGVCYVDRIMEGELEGVDLGWRMLYIKVEANFIKVVLTSLDVPIEVLQTEENINSATRTLLDVDAEKPIRLGQPLIRIAILEKPGSTLRVVLRLSHALYDGLSLEHILRSPHILFKGGRLPTPPKFAGYMQHIASTRRDGYDFWRSVLQGSSMTVIKGNTSNSALQQQQQGAPSGAHHASKVISIPLQANADSRITQVTTFTAACALTLAKEDGSSDVVFGRTVSGRQGLPLTYQNVIGPCLNQVPVRARIDKSASRRELLREMQDQYLNSLAFETLGVDEIKKNCTDWSDTTTSFGCCIVYQNFDSHPDSQMEEQRLQIGVLSRNYEAIDEGLVHDLVIAGESEPDGWDLRVTVVANKRLCDEARMKRMLEELCGNIQALALAQ